MQNWNQWPVPSGTVSAAMPPPPTGYTAPGTDPMATMQAYMQYYNQPAPSGYTPEQWSAAQQQNWAQWQQWQQQYQQWQAQYGEKYQETMKQYGVTGQQAPPLPLTSQPPPPPPKDDKPPLPPSGNISVYGYSTGAPPPPPATSNVAGIKRASGSETEVESAKKIKESDEELSEAEKTFDAQFKQWEEKFNTWKLQNANHPDKTQYKQYEAKWTSWREKLIERREQMRRKREQQKLAAAAKAEAEKKDMPGGDKILNILSSTENQGLINNLLGIGKTLGLTTKQDHATITSTAATVPIAPTIPIQQQPMVPPQVAMAPMMQPDMSQAWAQWNQYNPAMNTSMPPMGQPIPTQIPQYSMQHIPMTGPPPHQIPPPNFSQPPPGFPPANFSQPPPGYSQPPPPLNTNPPPPPVSQPPININIQQLSKCPPPNLLGTGFVNNQSNQQRGLGKDSNQFRQGSNEDNQSSNFNNRGNWNNRGNRNNFNQGNRNNYNQGNPNDFNKGNDDNDKFGGSNKGGTFGRGSQDNYNNDNNYENCNDDYNKFNFNNFGNKDNNRFINRQQPSNQQQSEDNMPPELKKLMAKRKAVTDVFKPSSGNFGMDSSSNTSSLSESFKKVSGDKVFGKGVNFRDEKFGSKFRGGGGFDPPDDLGGVIRGKFGQDIRGSNDFGNDGSNNFGNRGSTNNFGTRGPNDFSNTNSNNFGTRISNNFENRNLNEFGNRVPNNFVNKGLNFGNFGNRVPNNDFVNKESSENQDLTELSNQVPPDPSNFHDQIVIFGNSENTDKDLNKKSNSSDKPLDFENSNNQLLSSNNYDNSKEGPLDNFNNTSGQKEFSFVDGKESNDFVQNKNSGSKEINQMPPNFDVPPPSLKIESDYTTDNIAEFQCSDQSLNPHKQKLENAENEQQFDTITNEQQLDNAIDKNIPLIEKDISFVDPIELKISDKQDSSDVIESIEAINPMIDESAWIPCENELKSNGETITVQIPTEGDSNANPNEQLKEISADQDIKQNNDFDADIQQQKSDTLPFMGAEDPKAEDMNLQPPPEQPNVAIITTLEEPPTPSFTDEISEEGNFENKNSDKKFQHPPPRDDFNNGNLNDGSFNAPACQTGNFGRQEPSFKSGQFNTAPPPFGQRGNFNQPPPGPSNSKSTIPSLLTLKIDPPPMMLMPSRSGLSDDDQFDSDDQFPHNKSFDADVPQSNLDNNFGSGPFGFNKPPPFNTDGSVDKDRNFSPGPFGPSKSLFNKDGSIDKDRNFSPNSFGSNKFTFGKDGTVGIERNFASGTFGSSKSQFGKDGPVDKDRNFSSSPFGSKKSPFGEDGPLDKERNFGPSGPNKFPFVQEGSIGNDRNFGPGSFGFNKSTCSQDGLMERDRNFRSGLYGPNKPLIGKDGLLLNKGRNFGPLGPFGANRLLGKDGPLNIDTNFGSGLNNISPSNDLPIDDGKNIGPGLLGVVPNLLGSNPRLNELSSIDTNFCAESNHQCDDFSSMFNDGKNNLNEDFVNHNDPSNNSGQSDLEIEKNFNIDSDNSPFSKNLKGTGFSDGSMDIDNRSFGHGQFSSTLQQFSAGSTRNRAQSFDFQATFNSTRLDDAPLNSPNQSLIDTNKTVDSFEKSSGFGILVRRGMNEDFRTSGPEFCVGKQFNYNHGEILQDKSLDFLAPTKIIDYSHETRVGVFEFVEPVGIFDYGHGKLKPSIPDIIQDFQNWEDNEHNLNEYNEEMRKRSEKVGRMWTSPSRSTDKSLWDEPKLLLKDKKERNESRDGEKDRDDRRRDKDRDERRDRDRDERLNDRLRDKDRNREKDRDDRYADRNRIDKDRDDRYRDSDRYGDRSRDKDRDDRYRISDRDRDRSRDKDRDDRYKDREDRYKDRDDRYKDRDDRYKDRSYDKDRPYDKDRDERYKDRGYEKDRDDRYKDRVDKDLKDKNIDKDVKNKNSEKDMKDRSLEKELKDKSSEKDLTDRNLEKVSKDKNFDKDSQDGILETDCEDDNSEKDNDLRAKRDTLPEQKEDEMVVEKSSSPEKNKEQEEKGNKSKDLEKSDDRSKGNISWQDSAAIISTDTTPLQDSSLSEIKQNVLENPPKIMELPKTPNLTMVDDILCTPGRLTRPPKIAIILRGPPGSGKSFVAKLIKDKEIAQGGSAPRILSIDDYFLVEKDSKPSEDNKKDGVDEMEYKYEEAMEPEYVNHLFKAFKKNITDGFFNFIILDSINEKISDYEEMWSFAKTKGFKVYVCEMEMDVQICLKRNIHKRSEDEINRIVDYFEPAPSHHHKLDVTSLLQEQAIEDVEMEDVQDTLKEEVNEKEKEKENENEAIPTNDDSQDSQEETEETGVSKWEKMEAEDKLDRLDGLKRKHDNRPQTMEEFLQVPDYYDAEDNSGKKHVRWADLEERKEQEKMRAVGFVVGQTNWNRMMDPTHGGSALTRTKYI